MEGPGLYNDVFVKRARRARHDASFLPMSLRAVKEDLGSNGTSGYRGCLSEDRHCCSLSGVNASNRVLIPTISLVRARYHPMLVRTTGSNMR